jgi:hypothetical protein
MYAASPSFFTSLNVLDAAPATFLPSFLTFSADLVTALEIF